MTTPLARKESLAFCAKWTVIRAIMVAVCVTVGCSKKEPIESPTSSPPPIFTGPAFLHGTVGSMARLRGSQPQLVSGYGLIVNLRGTGSSEVPAFLRQWLINQMRKRGIGSAKLGTQWMTPEQVLASPNTAVVLVQGLIPPGATKGTRFDVLVSALSQTQTTSLVAGQLWTADLSRFGQDPSMRFSRKLAQAGGPMFSNPFLNPDHTSDQQGQTLRRQGVVLSGGVATSDRQLQLILNQASWQRSRMIADRINERFPKAPADRRDTAVPINDSTIELNVPSRYEPDPDELLRLISHLYTQRGPNVETVQAARLADLVVADRRYAQDAIYALQALGKTIIPVIRKYYDHPEPEVRLTLLETACRLQDELSTDHLLRIAETDDPGVRRKAAEILKHIPRSLRGARTLHTLLDDPDPAVRIKAYESLSAIHDPIVQRLMIGDRERFKFVLDLVPASKPLLYIVQTRLPRIVLFNPKVRMEHPFVARLWDNHLMLRGTQPGEPVTVFYQHQADPEGKTYQIKPTVQELITFLAHRPTSQNPDPGLDLSFSEVAAVLYSLTQEGFVQLDTEVQVNPLAAMITQVQDKNENLPRPATAKDDLFEPYDNDPVNQDSIDQNITPDDSWSPPDTSRPNTPESTDPDTPWIPLP